MKKYAVIVAGGKGDRMKSSEPKQFMLLNKIPILIHVLRKFYSTDKKIKLILALPRIDNILTTWNKLCRKYNCTVPHIIVYGGENRFKSVKNSLEDIGATLTIESNLDKGTTFTIDLPKTLKLPD